MVTPMEDVVETKSQPYTFDLGHLMCSDPNPLPSLKGTSDKESVIRSTAQGCAQALIAQLLNTCPIDRNSDGDLQIKLPEPEFRLPREKPVPKEKEQTKWEKFAAKKGIKAKRKDGKLVYDEEKGDWIPKYGYKGKNAEGGDWLVEVDEKAERKKAAEAAGKVTKPKKGGNKGR